MLAGIERGISQTPRLCALKLLAKRLDARPVGAEVVVTEPRRGAHVDDTVRAAETALEVIGKAEPGSADRVDVLVRCGDDGGARHTG